MNERFRFYFFRLLLLPAVFWLTVLFAAAQENNNEDEDENHIVPVRPSVSESAQIQKRGVLQIEYGADFDFDAPDFRNRQAGTLGVYFAATKRLRLDFEFETFAAQRNRMNERESGTGDVNLGFKFIARARPEERLAAAFSYSIKLPAADQNRNLGTGRIDHNLRLIFSRAYGKNEFTVNFSYLNVGREREAKRASGAQAILRYDRKLARKFSFINEFYGNTVNEQQPRGLYYLGALTYRANKRLQLDAGIRPGFGRDVPNFSFFFGASFGAVDLYEDK